MRKYVLDADAVLDYLGNRPGGRRVGALLDQALDEGEPLSMSVVNWGEVLAIAWAERGEAAATQTRAAVEGLPIVLCPVSADDAFEAARLKAVHKLPYADSFAASLAMRQKAILVTSDTDFERLGKRLAILWLR
jgi:predicted nucleic acid-binding protein